MNLNQLLSSGQLTGTPEEIDAIVSPQEKIDLPTIAKVLMGIGGWLSAIFLSGFIFVLIEGADSQMLALVVGVIFLGVSVYLSRLTKHPFISQTALALGSTGYVLMMFGAWESLNPDGLGALILAGVLCPIVYGLSGNSIQKFSSIFIVYIIFWCRINSWGDIGILILWQFLGLVVVAFFMSGFLKGDFWRPAMFGVCVGLFLNMAMELTPLFDREWAIDLFFALGIALCFPFVIWRLIKPKDPAATVGLIGGAVLLFALSWFGGGGMAVSLGLILIAHARNDRSLKALGIIGLVGFTIAFYYFLGTSLINKSWLLMGSGICLIALSLLFRKRPATV